ncbi:MULTISPECIES: hypothetical protein [unclassified Streptomyces]|uniref:hypothetical protein n=1 Tax=unclassified Streptomyces TaxID=2593676 RepID=UPI0036B3A2F9
MTGGNRFSTDIDGGHIGLAVTIIALIVVAGFSGARWTSIVAGGFTAWFILALTFIHIRADAAGKQFDGPMSPLSAEETTSPPDGVKRQADLAA